MLRETIRPAFSARKREQRSYPTAVPALSSTKAPSVLAASTEVSVAPGLANSPPTHTFASPDREHYQARSAECRRLAAAAADPAVKLIHLDMATRYDFLARTAGEARPQLHSVK